MLKNKMNEIDYNEINKMKKYYEDIDLKNNLNQLESYFNKYQIKIDDKPREILKKELFFTNSKIAISGVLTHLFSWDLLGKIPVIIVSKITDSDLAEVDNLLEFYGKMSFFNFDFSIDIRNIDISKIKVLEVYMCFNKKNIQIAKMLESEHIKKYMSNNENIMNLLRQAEKNEQN